jgi:hypothetical protein
MQSGAAHWKPFFSRGRRPGPTRVHNGPDDKEWAAGDANPSSPFHGHVYAAWDDASGSALHFARTTDHGATWIGVGNTAAGTALLSGGCFAPEINVAADGTVYIVFLQGNAIKMVVSADGGDSFHPRSLSSDRHNIAWQPRLAALSRGKLPCWHTADSMCVRQNGCRSLGRFPRHSLAHLLCAFD